MSIFKANDIRGHYGTELTEEHAYWLGRAFVHMLKATGVVVGCDNRISSPNLLSALIEGISDQGADVIDIGTVDSPAIYFASVAFSHPAIMVTASHNPAVYNGFYLCKANAEPINESNGLQQIEKLMKRAKFPEPTKIGLVEKVGVVKEYLKHLLSFVDVEKLKPLRVVVDAGNGMGGWIVPKLLEFLPFDVIPLNWDSDGYFPSHGPDPARPENLTQLRQKVRETGADIGIAFDGDADRAAFVDDQGEIVEGSYAGALMARSLLARFPESPVVYSSTCSRILSETIHELGGKPVREKVGRTFMQMRMRHAQAVFGVESTGHYFFQRNWYMDSGPIAALVMLGLLSESKQPLSELVAPLKKEYYQTPEANFLVKKPESKLPALARALKVVKAKKTNNFDGLSFDCGSYWFSVRASHTESFIRLTVEAPTREQAEKAEKRIIPIIKKVLHIPDETAPVKVPAPKKEPLPKLPKMPKLPKAPKQPLPKKEPIPKAPKKIKVSKTPSGGGLLPDLDDEGTSGMPDLASAEPLPVITTDTTEPEAEPTEVSETAESSETTEPSEAAETTETHESDEYEKSLEVEPQDPEDVKVVQDNKHP